MIKSIAAICLLALAIGASAGPTAVEKCPGTPSGSSTPVSGAGGFFVDGPSSAKIVFVQAAFGASGFSVVPYGGASAAIGTDGERTTIGGSGGCVQVNVPQGASLDVFINGGAVVDFGALALSALTVRTDGPSQLLSANPVIVSGNCSFTSNGPSTLVLWSNANVCGATTAKGDGASDTALFGTYASVKIFQLNGQTAMFIGAVNGPVTVELMDGASRLRIAGTPGMVVSGKQQGGANNIKLLSGTCGAGLPRCQVVPSDIGFWDNGKFFNNPLLNS